MTCFCFEVEWYGSTALLLTASRSVGVYTGVEDSSTTQVHLGVILYRS